MFYGVYFNDQEADFGMYTSIVLAEIDEEYDYDIVNTKLVFTKYLSFKELKDKDAVNSVLRESLTRLGSEMTNCGHPIWMPEYEVTVYPITAPRYKIA